MNYLKLFQTYLDQEKYELALYCINKCIKLKPKDKILYLIRGILYRNHFKNYPKAIKDYTMLEGNLGDLGIYFRDESINKLKKKIFQKDITKW